MRRIYLSLFFITKCLLGISQFHPAANSSGSNAIHKDSSIIVAWAISADITRGYINILDTNKTFTQENTTSNLAFFGNNENCLGYPNSIEDVVSLGDGGFAILKFEHTITDNQGYDFVVFENGLKSQFAPFQYFLELALVEVSEDGKKFVRFPATSYTEKSVSTYSQIFPEKINNLAGKYATDYGTPFDLSEIKDAINVNNINYIKIIDVIGCEDDKFCSYDIFNNKIYDPFPTPFWSGGFDLAGVGIINIQNAEKKYILYPNPAKDIIFLYVCQNSDITIYDIYGNTILNYEAKTGDNKLYINMLKKGIYLLKTNNEVFKFIKL